MRAIRHFYGTDSYGRAVERAQRSDGVWFARHQTSYGGMCGWYQCDPDWESQLVNQYDGTVIQCEPETVMSWGFGHMRDVTAPKMRLRLPDHAAAAA